ncbi:hypothetical protein ACPPVS_18890 [Cellulomonas sp. McL0617]|uniref:hypothetical protein n=1 Tax=Cellulomonas sp. McL0617 TaxID=3415675 RepID=UPI003CEC15D3
MASRTEAPGDAAPTIILVNVNHRTGEATLTRSDGKTAPFAVRPMPDEPIVGTMLALIDKGAVVFTTARGDQFGVELPSLHDAAPLAGRPVVYLDQQAWSKISRARNRPHGTAAGLVDTW